MIIQQLRNFRKQAKITQKEMAEKVGIKDTSLSNYETGKRKIPLEIAERICDELDKGLKIYDKNV